MRRVATITLIIGLSWLPFTSRADDLAQQLVASTLITGSVRISPDGEVKDYSIDQMSKLPPAAQALLQQTIARWRFERNVSIPVDINERMTVRLMAKPVEGNKQAISVADVTFTDDIVRPGEALVPDNHPSPKYPQMSRDARVGGVVYLLALVGKDGHVKKVVTEQVNLRALLSPKDQERYRKNLSNAATEAVTSWTWKYPTSGPFASKSQFWVRLPIDFSLHVIGTPLKKDPGYGDWDAYIPGPRLPFPNDDSYADVPKPPTGTDAIGDGTGSVAESSVRLITPLSSARE